MSDRAYGPREGKSAISAATRQRIYGGGGGGGGIRGGSPGSAYSNDYDQLLNQMGGGGLGQLLMQLLGQGQSRGGEAADYLRTKAEVRDPVGWAIKQREAGDIARNANPWGEGGLFEGRMAADTMTPAQIMASQGMSAKNQWASQMPAGSTTPSGVDTDELRRLNEAQRGRYKTYM